MTPGWRLSGPGSPYEKTGPYISDAGVDSTPGIAISVGADPGSGDVEFDHL